MSLLDRLKIIEERAGQSNICPVKRLLDGLDVDTADILRRLIEGRTSIRRIHQELQNDGHRIARETLSAHRNGWCACKEKA